MSDKVTIVTGASKGIGRAVAIALSSAGASVLISSRNASELTVVAKECNAQGGRALAVAADITDPDAVAVLVSTAVKQFGHVDTLINCAASIGPMGLLEDITLDAWQTTVQTNLTGTYLTCRQVIPIMKEHGSGSIINVASTAAIDTSAGFAAYNSSKAAVIALTKTLAKELHPFGIRANSICPGPVDTPMVDQIVEADAPQGKITNIDLFRQMKRDQLLWSPDEVTDLFLFLASDESRLITGQFIQNTWKPVA